MELINIFYEMNPLVIDLTVPFFWMIASAGMLFTGYMRGVVAVRHHYSEKESEQRQETTYDQINSALIEAKDQNIDNLTNGELISFYSRLSTGYWITTVIKKFSDEQQNEIKIMKDDIYERLSPFIRYEVTEYLSQSKKDIFLDSRISDISKIVNKMLETYQE